VAEPEWLDLDVVLEIHGKNLIRFGGATGLRDLVYSIPLWLAHNGFTNLIPKRTYIALLPLIRLGLLRVIRSLTETKELGFSALTPFLGLTVGTLPRPSAMPYAQCWRLRLAT
jgi:hypothetical protein